MTASSLLNSQAIVSINSKRFYHIKAGFVSALWRALN